MRLSEVCQNYFNGFQEISNFQNNDSETNAMAILKILSYFTVAIPLSFAAVYGTASLYDRVTVKEDPSIKDSDINTLANQVFNTEAVVIKVDSVADSPEPSKLELADVLDAYNQYYAPRANRKNLEEYSQSEDYQRHAKTARIYYNSSQLEGADALKIIFQREPTNIAMVGGQYEEDKLEELFGYREGVFNDPEAKKADGSSFKDFPNTASVYSETYLWNPPGGKNKKEIACLSLPAPALDSRNQPHYRYYMSTDALDAEKYEQEMKFLFGTIEKAARDNKDSAFEGKGIKRLVLSKFGQGAFLEALSAKDRKIANDAYKQQLAAFMDRMKDTGLEIVMSEYSNPGKGAWLDRMIIGDILKVAEEGDLIINAWDPHSAPGNGNDGDQSFDGAMGKGSGILLTQTSWLNKTLSSEDSLVQSN